MIQFPAVPDGDDLRISASSFVAFRQCSELASARFAGEYGPDTMASFRGGLAHRVFARHLTEGPISEGEFEDVCRREIGSSALNHKLAGLALKPSDLGRTIEEVASLYRRFVKFPTEGFAGAEVTVEAEPALGVALFGSIDAVFAADGATRLVDWKTGGMADADVQLAFYALVWALDRGSLPAAVEAVSVATGERVSEAPTRTEVTTTAGEVAQMVSVLRRAWATGGSLARTGGPWCKSCPRLSTCAEGKAAVRLPEA